MESKNKVVNVQMPLRVIVIVIVLVWTFYVIRYFYCHDYQHLTSKETSVSQLTEFLQPGDLVFIGGMETSLGGTFGWGGLVSAFLNQYHFHPTLITSGSNPSEKWIWEFNAKAAKRKEKMAFDSSNHIYKMNLSDYLRRYQQKFPLASFEVYRLQTKSLIERQEVFEGHKMQTLIKSMDQYTYGWNIGSILGLSEGGSEKIHCNEFVGKVLEQTGMLSRSENSPYEYLSGNLKDNLSYRGYVPITKVRLRAN